MKLSTLKERIKEIENLAWNNYAIVDPEVSVADLKYTEVTIRNINYIALDLTYGVTIVIDK